MPVRTVKAGVVVQAAVDVGLVPNTRDARREYADWCARDSTAAVQALVGYRKVAAAAAPPTVPAGHEVSSRPATATPSAEPLYPSSWSPPASQLRAKGLRHRVGAAVVRAAQTVYAPGDTSAYLAANRATADANRVAAQRRINAHTDPHTLIAAAAAPARAQQAAEQAELARRAAAHRARYGG